MVTVQIEAIMNDFIQLEPQSNVFEAETMIEGSYSLPPFTSLFKQFGFMGANFLEQINWILLIRPWFPKFVCNARIP